MTMTMACLRVMAVALVLGLPLHGWSQDFCSGLKSAIRSIEQGGGDLKGARTDLGDWDARTAIAPFQREYCVVSADLGVEYWCYANLESAELATRKGQEIFDAAAACLQSRGQAQQLEERTRTRRGTTTRTRDLFGRKITLPSERWLDGITVSVHASTESRQGPSVASRTRHSVRISVEGSE